MAKKKRANKAEREHLGRVASLGCIACRNMGYPDTPAAVHHIASGAMGKRASHYETIPLCGEHHQTGGHGVAVHAGRETWERIHGTERELLQQTLELLGDEVNSN